MLTIPAIAAQPESSDAIHLEGDMLFFGAVEIRMSARQKDNITFKNSYSANFPDLA